MEAVLSSFANVLSGDDPQHDKETKDSLSANLLTYLHSWESPNSAKIESLLRISQAVNRAVLELQKTSNTDFIESSLDDAVSTIIADCVGKSQYQINRAIEELLKKSELFQSTNYPVESDEAMLATAEALLSDPPAPSAVYVPRPPRLPGLPMPPADQFGDWDEYRDDLDPGYRVKEAYEDDYLRDMDAGSQSTANTGSLVMDELMRVAPPPSSQLMTDENDELLGAASVCHSQTTPSVCAVEIVASNQRSDRAACDSPTFGSVVPPSVGTTTMYEYKGRTREVPRPLPEKKARTPLWDDTKKSNVMWPSNYPLKTPDGSVTLEEIKLPVIYQQGKTGFESSKKFDSSPGVIVAGRFKIIGFLGQAAFSKAVKAMDLQTNTEVCLKIIKNDKDFIDQSLDEIKILSLLKASGADRESNCLSLLECMYWKEHLILVTELLRDNLYEFSKFNRNPANQQMPYFTIGRLQKITKQILSALHFIHSAGIIHCDLKPENILFKSYTNCEIKVIDFGSACFETDKLSTYVQSRCYRAPEVILGCLPYDCAVDMWSLGCILAELWTGFVLFQNDSSQSLLARVIGILGPLPAWMLKQGRNVPHLFTQAGELYVELDAAGVVGGKGRLLQILVPKQTSLFQRMRIEDGEFLEFLSGVLQVDPALRLTAEQALSHSWLAPGRYPDGL